MNKKKNEHNNKDESATIPSSKYLTWLCKRLKNGDTKEECINNIHIDGNPYINFVLFAKHLINKGKRERTVKQYLFTIHNFWDEVNEETLESYTDYVYHKSLSLPNSNMCHSRFLL